MPRVYVAGLLQEVGDVELVVVELGLARLALRRCGLLWDRLPRGRRSSRRAGLLAGQAHLALADHRVRQREVRLASEQTGSTRAAPTTGQSIPQQPTPSQRKPRQTQFDDDELDVPDFLK